MFFSARACLDEVQPKTYRAASLVELLHTATLVHDDVVDDSFERRGFFSINALWKNKIAVLVGDYLLSRGLLIALDNGDYDLLQIMSTAVKAMSEGELLQWKKHDAWILRKMCILISSGRKLLPSLQPPVPPEPLL